MLNFIKEAFNLDGLCVDKSLNDHVDFLEDRISELNLQNKAMARMVEQHKSYAETSDRKVKELRRFIAKAEADEATYEAEINKLKRVIIRQRMITSFSCLALILVVIVIVLIPLT